MEAKNYRKNIDGGKVMGIIFLVIFSLMFIFSCMKSVLPIGAIIVGTFGVMTFPLLVFLALLCIAKILGLNYTRNKKTTIYGLIILFSLLFAIHSIATFRELNLVVSFESLKIYLSLSYNKVTLVGSAGSVICGLISMLLGSMGVIVVFVIMATLFIGLFVDYNFYGKYENKNIRKINNKRVRERVRNSDKEKTVDGSPEWSFSNNNYTDDDIASTITYSENQTAYAENNVSYADSDVIDEITSYPESSYETNTYAETNQTLNTFDNDFYKEDTIPDIYKTDSYEQGKKFLSDTFGMPSSINQTPVYEPVNIPSYEDTNISSEDTFESELNELSNSGINISNSAIDTSFGIKGFENDLGNNMSNPFEDDISDILNIDEDTEIEQEIPEIPTLKVDNTSNFIKPAPQPASNTNTFSNGFNKGFDTSVAFSGNSLSNTQLSSAPQQISQPITIPTKNPSQPPISGIPVGIPGIRYNPPPLNLLRPAKPDTGDYSEEQTRKSKQLEDVLEAFKVKATVKNVVRGPKITRYELDLPLGVSVNKIPQYENDIARALAAKTITIKAPIPGKSFVGIELENDTYTSVYERELLESYEFLNSKDPLPIAIGKDISGDIVIKSLAKMVHLLIAGSTGSGKSVFIHNIVMSLLYKYGPDDLRLIMIDPKKVEFNRYNGLPHLVTPEVVMGSEKAINALKWCVKEMDRRYGMMQAAGYNNIEPYNKSELVKAGQFEHMPYIVIIVDELAELMLANKKDTEHCIQRITQLARACGMHLILATQRPSVDVISGVIKANMPSRIAFSLQTGIDSRTILGAVGAEKLLGQGDMIFAPTGTSATPRLQAAYASDDEIKAVIDYCIKYNPSNYDENIERAFDEEQSLGGESGGSSDSSGPKEALDGYFKKALKIVMLNGGASTSYLQRRLAIGYSRAAKIIDQMEERGYIAHASGSKQRQVLITPEKFKEDFGEDFDNLND